MKKHINNLINFLKEVWMEVHPKKGNVDWPQRDEVVGSTIAVLIAVLISAVYIGLLDYVFSNVLFYIINLAS
jgi:preprotein translocase SecE subunit